MKTFLLLICFSITCQVLYAQSVLNPEWTKQVYSNESGSAEAWGVDVDDEGEIYWPINVDSIGNHDIYCYRLNDLGEEQWTNPYHFESANDEFSHICDASSDFMYVGGSTCPLPGVNCDMHLIKIDKSNGEFVWEQTQDFGNNGYDEVDGLEVRSDGIYVSGWAQAIQSGLWQIDMGLWKMDLNGNTEWSNQLGSPNTGEHLDGHFIVEENRIVATGLWEGTSGANIFNGKSFIGSFSKEDGSLIDSSLFNYNPDQFLFVENPLGMTTDGTNYYVTGYVSPVTINDYEIFIAKFDQNLNLVWNEIWGGTVTESARALAIQDGKIYIAGLTTSPEISQNGEGDALLLVYDTDGNFISHHVWGGEQLDSFRDIVIHDNAIYLSGISGTGFSSQESVSANLIKVNIDDVSGISDNVAEEDNMIKIYPNPTNGQITISLNFQPNSNTILDIRNAIGQTVFSKKLMQKETSFNILAESGIYAYQILNNGRLNGAGKIVLQ